MFDNFDNFDFMYDELAQDIVVTPQVTGQDDLGRTTSQDGQPVHLKEPILNTMNPNFTYNDADAEQMETIQYFWESRHGEFNKGDTVETSVAKFKVTDKAQDVAGGLWFYLIKKIGSD